MGRILLVIKLIVVAVPFFALGYFLHYFFRFTPEWAHILITVAVLAACMYFVYKNRKVFIDKGAESEIPEIFHMSSFFYLIAGALAGYLLSQSSFKTQLYIDNGKAVPVVVTVMNGDTIHVQAHSCRQQTVPLAALDIAVDGVSKTFSVTEKGKWIYNIDSLNTYIESSISYSDEVTLTKEGSTDSSKTELPHFKFVTGEFFKTDVDYLFEAPESITIKKRDAGKEIEKTVLYRLPADDEDIVDGE